MTLAEEVIKIAGKMVQPFKFNTLSIANDFIDKAIKPASLTIVLGDDELFWVVTRREAGILKKAGYSMAEGKRKHQVIDQTGNPQGKEGQGKVVGEFDSHKEAETFLVKFEKNNPNSYCEIAYKK